MIEIKRRLTVRPPGPVGRVKKQWLWKAELRRLENTLHGVAFQVVDVVETLTGALHHEAVIPLGRRSELHIIVRDDGQLGFVLHERENTIPPDVASRQYQKDPQAILNPFSEPIGLIQYECVHGVSTTPESEAEEESGLQVFELNHIGWMKDNTASGGAAHYLYATRVSTHRSQIKGDRDEPIHGFTFFAAEDVRKIETLCALTQAALWRFRCWGLEQPPDSFWRTVAERL